MSSLYVREQLRAAWPGILPSIPLFDTVNTAPSDMEVELPIWATLMFDVSNRGPVTMGSNPWVEEVGVAQVVIMSYSGVGDDEIAQAAQLVVDAWGAWIDSTQNLWVQSVDGPRPPDPEAAGDVYRMMVTLNYVYQTRGGS